MKKVILSLLMASLMMSSCSSDDSDSIEDSQPKTEEVENKKKGVFTIKYSQSGDIENTITIFAITPVIDNQVSSSIKDLDKDSDIGSVVFINMHDKKEGTYSYKTTSAVESVLLVLNGSVDNKSTEDYQYSIIVTKDGKEVFNKSEVVKKGTSSIIRNFTVN